MKLRTLRASMPLAGKRVLLRIDANVPVKKGKAVDGPQGRIARSAVDIDWLMQRGAKIVLLTHLGRPDGKFVSAYSVAPVAKRLSELLRTKVKTVRGIADEKARQAVARLQNGEVLLLENVRFHPLEKKDDVVFAKQLAALGDLYINDAFAVCHRPQTSVHAIAKEMPSYAGPLLAQEIAILSKAMQHPRAPFVLVVGGVKMETKLPVIQRLLPRVQSVLVGGALAHAFMKAKGLEIGRSVYDEEGVAQAARMLKQAGKKIILPEDVVVVSSLRKDAAQRIVDVTHVGVRDRIVDIGPKTVEKFLSILREARTIVWNGPLGYCEIKPFAKGTFSVAEAIAKRTGKALTIVGGGDTGPVIEEGGFTDQYTLLSTGGGAMLTFLSGELMPPLEVLKT
jgi:phosphoglycerate kinase